MPRWLIGAVVLLTGLWLVREWFRLKPRRAAPPPEPPAPAPPHFVSTPRPMSDAELASLRRSGPEAEPIAGRTCRQCGKPALAFVKTRELAVETLREGRRSGFISLELRGICTACGHEETVLARR